MKINKILFFLCFILFFLTEQAFSCPYMGSSFTEPSGVTWQVTNSCYPSASAASAALAPLNLYSKFSATTPNAFGAGTIHAPNGTIFMGGYEYPTGSHKVVVLWVDYCASPRAQATQQCGGPDNFDIDEMTCAYTCKPPPPTCPSERAAASASCGGDDKYYIDELCQWSCKSDCPAACSSTAMCSNLANECGGKGTYSVDPVTCKGTCNPSGDCAEEYEQKTIECGGQPAYWDNTNCTGVCQDCRDQYEQAKQQCAKPFPNRATNDPCDYTCDCKEQMDQADKDCPFGFTMDTGSQEPCAYKCLTCDDLANKCIEQCGSQDNVSVFKCDSTNQSPTDYLCRCKDQENCSGFRDSCERACSTPECGGVKSVQRQESGGKITYSKCDCNGCAKNPPENPDPKTPDPNDKDGDGIPDSQDPDRDGDGVPNGDDPTPDGTPGGGGGTPTPDPNPPSTPPGPGDNSELVSWLRAIKGDTGDIVRQLYDQTAWLKEIKHNGDTGNDIAKQGFGAVVSSVNDVKKSIDAGNKILGDIKDGLANSTVSVQATGSYAVTEGSYGEAPKDSDLPTEEQTKSAFGEFKPGTGNGYRDVIKDALPGMVPSASSASCNSVIHLPVPTLSGFNWHDYPVNFCDYESIFAMIGSVFVFLTALHELYSLT